MGNKSPHPIPTKVRTGYVLACILWWPKNGLWTLLSEQHSL